MSPLFRRCSACAIVVLATIAGACLPRPERQPMPEPPPLPMPTVSAGALSADAGAATARPLAR